VKLDECFDYNDKTFRRVIREISRAIPGQACAVTICVGTACRGILNENRSATFKTRSCWIVVVPSEEVTRPEDSRIAKVCVKPFDYDGSPKNTSFRFIIVIEVPPAGGSFDKARAEIYREGGRVQELIESVRRAIEYRYRYCRALMIVAFITPGASSTASIDLIFKHLVEPLRQSAENLGVAVYTVVLVQISDPGTDKEEELARRREKFVETITQTRGTIIIYMWPRRLSNKDLMILVETIEAAARRDGVIPPTDMGDIFRDGAIYEVVAPPTPIGSQYYDELLKKEKELKSNEIHIIAVGGRLIDRVERDLIAAGIEVRNKMVLKILKEDYPPTVLVLRRISLNEALKRIDEMFRAEEQTK